METGNPNTKEINANSFTMTIRLPYGKQFEERNTAVIKKLKDIVSERNEKAKQANPKAGFSLNQLGAEMLYSWYDKQVFDENNPDNLGIDTLKSKNTELELKNRRLSEQLKVLQGSQLTSEISEKLNSYDSLKKELDEKKGFIQMLQNTTSENKLEEFYKSEIHRLKTIIRNIGDALSKSSGYYVNNHFSTLKTNIIKILTEL